MRRSAGSEHEEITRAELVEIVVAASNGCVESTKAKFRAVAETTDAVAAGWFHCDGVSCPSRQARRQHQGFQSAYDVAMAKRFGRGDEYEPFVVRVTEGLCQQSEDPR